MREFIAQVVSRSDIAGIYSCAIFQDRDGLKAAALIEKLCQIGVAYVLAHIRFFYPYSV